MVGKNRKITGLRTIGLHAAVWILLFALNDMFIESSRVQLEFSYQITIWLIYAVLFYLNFSLLIPFLFFRKKMWLYFLIIIPLLTGTYFLKRQINMQHMRKRILSEMENPSRFQDRWRRRIPPPDMHGPRFEPHHGPFPRYDFMSLYGTLLVFTASTSLAFMQKWRLDEQKRNEHEKERITAELRYLKQQINPHFLFNALNSIYSLTINCPSPASDVVLKLSSILRYMLYETDNRQVTLTEEMEVVKNYIDIQQLRLTDKVKVSYLAEGITDNLIIEPLILIPLLENAFKYGVDNLTESYIKIQVKVEGDQLEAIIENNIVQRPTDKTDSGIGLKNIIRRLDLLYADNYDLNISEKDDVFTVLLRLRLKSGNK